MYIFTNPETLTHMHMHTYLLKTETYVPENHKDKRKRKTGGSVCYLSVWLVRGVIDDSLSVALILDTLSASPSVMATSTPSGEH